ncbi:Signal transduction response regulator [Cinnamomum micranthum f. kanehirae]|uniref:histidine kinase n=1 Tax=Cinnamomum micranthum f. kanehirae TaxID=337451 RepID=A0A3S3P8P5_9MAGN|nr:Signal transduction response regulator [Cinnamomum micranthum f. kanehirae]
MAVRCKVSGFSGALRANSRAKESLQGSNGGWRWRRMLLAFWVLSGLFLSIWVSRDLKGVGLSTRKEKFADERKLNACMLQEQFNVSNDQIHTLATLLLKPDQRAFLDCMVKSATRMLLTDDFNQPLKDQCPVPEYIHEKFNSSSVHDAVMFSQDDISCKKEECQHILPLGEARSCKQPHEKLCIILLKIGWWVIVGIVVSCKFSAVPSRLWTNSNQQLLQQHQHQQGSKVGGRWRRKLLVLWILLGLILSMWIFWSMNKSIILWRKEMLANMCDERARMLQDQFNVSMNHVHALAILVSAFHHGKHPSSIDQKTFAEYTERTAFERPLTSGVAYALKVLHADRERFEKLHGWTIKKMETEDQSLVQDDYIPERLDPSPVQDEYAPVVFSQETVSHIVSIDMMSGKEDRENILRARASGKGVLTSPFKLLKSNRLGVVLTFAVYNEDLPADAKLAERIAATQGYLGASFDIPSLVEKLLQQLASKQTIVVNVYDMTNASAPINMYGPDITETGLWHLSNLDFGDPLRKHEMHCRFKQKPPLPWSTITTSVGVLVIFLLVGHIFHAALNRIAKVEDDYREMMELKTRAEAADVAKSQFLATVSHEIRTPMNGVLGMLQMLLDTDLDATQQDFARTAQASGKTLIALINEVLDQAKIESGRLELEAVPFDLRTILDNVLSLFSDKSQEKGIELAVYISDQVPEILTGDPGRFRQIITNLVGNSIKFTEQGHIFVSVHLAEEVCGLCNVNKEVLKQPLEFAKSKSFDTLSGFCVVDRWKSWESFKMLDGINSSDVTNRINLLVTVEDTGVGIPRNAQTHIFMPFMQADSSTSRNYGGTGIGLSISKCLVDLMGGEIGFMSEPGVGSTFAFTAVFMKGQTNSLDSKWQECESIFRGMKGLVVDERSVRAEVTKYHLQRLGIHMEIAISPENAFSCILNACNTDATGHLDMVLVDKEAWSKGTVLAFPRLLRGLRQNGRSRPAQTLPKMFLLATSTMSSAELDEFKSAGYVDNIIMKPLRLSLTAACLQKALGLGHKRHQDRGQPSTLQNLLSGKQILVVDDNVVNRRVAAGALKKLGAVVTCADSGKNALTKLQPPHQFDACFMDVQMPEMDGFEATRQIRSVENIVNEQIKTGEASKEMYGNVAHWHVPILAMTADVIQATNEECTRCGMDGYVSKPFEEEQLYSAVACFFESSETKLM